MTMGLFGGGGEDHAHAEVDETVEYKDPETGLKDEMNIHIEADGPSEMVVDEMTRYKNGETADDGGQSLAAYDGQEAGDDNSQRPSM